VTLLQAAMLGIVQGLTEFLPVSSSGHLILTRHLLGLSSEDETAFVFDVLVQMGTWLALLIYYRQDLLAIGRDMLRSMITRKAEPSNARLGWLIIVATLPAIVVGWWLRDTMSGELSGLTATGFFLLGTALLLVAAEVFGRRKLNVAQLTVGDALWIGFFQSLALLPGVSRSAATLSGGMTCNLNRPQAARFAFLMAVPVMPGAALVAWLQLGSLAGASALWMPLLVGFVASAIVGYFCIRWLINYLSKRSLFPFAAYCMAVGILAIFFG